MITHKSLVDFRPVTSALNQLWSQERSLLSPAQQADGVLRCSPRCTFPPSSLVSGFHLGTTCAL